MASLKDILSGFWGGVSRDLVIGFVRQQNRFLFPHLRYFHDLLPDERFDVLQRIPILAGDHDDWAILGRAVKRKDTAFFGPLPTMADVVRSHGAIVLEADGTTPKPITAFGSGYLLNNGYRACTSEFGLYMREGIRHDVNVDAAGVGNPYYSYSFWTPKFYGV